MSNLVIRNIQLGQSATASQNFVLGVPAIPDGSFKISRGNIGATTSELLNFDSLGKVSFPQGIDSSDGFPVFQCRAWANFNGVTSAIRASGNISSVVRNGTGDYTITFTKPLQDSNYVVSGTAVTHDPPSGTPAPNVGVLGLHSTNGVLTLKTATQVRIVSVDNNTDNLVDCFDINLVVHR